MTWKTEELYPWGYWMLGNFIWVISEHFEWQSEHVSDCCQIGAVCFVCAGISG